MSDSQNEERQVLTIEVPLDPLHRRADLALRDQGVDLEGLVLQQVTRMVEEEMYAAVQAVKYGTQEENQR